jgi:hypothetical protein
MSVVRPGRIVQQVLLQFVSLVGAGFVTVNPWIKKSLFSRQPILPPDVHLYLFATSSESMKSTGLLSSYITSERRSVVFAEFVSWPLGTVLAFSELNNPFLTPIRHWAEVPVKSTSTRDLILRVNDTHNPQALDFRSPAQVERDTCKIYDGQGEDISAEILLEMQRDWFQKSGSADNPGLAYVTSSKLKLKVSGEDSSWIHPKFVIP